VLYLNHSLIKEMVLKMENYKIKVNNEAESREAQDSRYKTGSRKVYGVGINDIPNIAKTGNPNFWMYTLWKGVLARSFSKKLKKQHETYNDVTCCDDWFVFSNFMNDIRKIENFDKYSSESWHLDKDILVKGNKIYSKDTVCFVPSEVNNLVIKSNKTRGDMPIGLSIHKDSGKIQVRVSKGGRSVFLGKFNNINDAFSKYKKEKELYIKYVAMKWKGIISDNVFNALINYEVNIDD